MTANYLSTFLWLNTPKKFIENSKEKLLAGCFAAISPTKQQIQDYYEQVHILEKSKRYSQEECLYLRQNPTLMRIYTVSTYNSPVSHKPSLLESVEIYKNGIEQQLHETDSKMKDVRQEFEKEREELEAIIQKYKADKEKEESIASNADLSAREFADGKIKILVQWSDPYRYRHSFFYYNCDY